MHIVYGIKNFFCDDHLNSFIIMGKLTVSETKAKHRHNPLFRDITTSDGVLRDPKKRTVGKSDETGDTEGYLDASTSRKILQLAREQQEELDKEDNTIDQSRKGFAQTLREQTTNEDIEEGDSSEEYSDFEEEYYKEEEIEVNEQDQALFERYFNSEKSGNSINLADKILAKIQEKELLRQSEGTSEVNDEAVFLPPKVIAAYEKIGQILTTYKHGKLPKLFKVLPTLKNWEQVLYVTNPEAWTPHATYEATKLFVSNLQANEAQKFIENVLLQKFRASIEDSENHSLDYHIYRAIKKSLYKPGAFFKGFLLPLIDDHCTVREATITASVLSKVSVPVLHSSVALTQLVLREFRPATMVFIRVLIEKKYALPYQTLDELVFYFMRFRRAAQEEEMGETFDEKMPPLPVVWHKAFLAFAQRYKNDITDDQRDFLLETVRQRFHHAIGPEIRRELLAGQPRVEDPKFKEVSMEDAF